MACRVVIQLTYLPQKWPELIMQKWYKKGSLYIGSNRCPFQKAITGLANNRPEKVVKKLD